MRDMETRRRYKHQSTDSNAVINVCTVIQDILQMRNMSYQELSAMNVEQKGPYIVKRLRLPIQILELLICN